jgi:hypothetical protein
MLAIFMSWFCLAFSWWDNIYSVFYAFTSRPRCICLTSLTMCLQ